MSGKRKFDLDSVAAKAIGSTGQQVKEKRANQHSIHSIQRAPHLNRFRLSEPRPDNIYAEVLIRIKARNAAKFLFVREGRASTEPRQFRNVPVEGNVSKVQLGNGVKLAMFHVSKLNFPPPPPTPPSDSPSPSLPPPLILLSPTLILSCNTKKLIVKYSNWSFWFINIVLLWTWSWFNSIWLAVSFGREMNMKIGTWFVFFLN